MMTEILKHTSPDSPPPPSEGAGVKGCFRLQITESGEIVGDSGWHENQITNLGFNSFLVSTLGAIAGSSQVGFIGIGTGGVPAATDTALANEAVHRAAASAATSATSKSVTFTGVFNSTQSFVAGNSNISNIGLFASSAAGTLFAGNVYASSTCATNQNVNVTYSISFV
jgi:hypothetical protein